MDVKNDTKQKIDMNEKLQKLEQDIKNLAGTIDKVEDEKLEVTNQLKKALADYSNLERDINKRIEIRSIQMRVQIAKSLLKTVDDIGFALKASESLILTDETKNWLDGLKGIISGVEKSLLELGINPINVNVGDQFDSSIHEAVTTIPTGIENTVYEVLQKGFQMGDIIVRPARVVISKNTVS